MISARQKVVDPDWGFEKPAYAPSMLRELIPRRQSGSNYACRRSRQALWRPPCARKNQEKPGNRCDALRNEKEDAL